jgi:pimeloyl-ACP methyl ester carboxylesterase
MAPQLVSERIGQFFVGEDRLEYTEYGAGDAWVVLLHGQLMPRRMQQPLARALAAEGLHVVTLDLLGHGRSDRPADPLVYSMTAFGEQVVALLDHLDAPQAVIGGTSLGANVALETVAHAPDRVRGLIAEMPVLDNALEAGLVAFGPMMLCARYLPFTVAGLRALTRPIPRGLVPFWAGIVLDTLDQQPAAMAATMHGIIFGRIAPPSRARRSIAVPALVVGHPKDPIHPAADAAMLAEEIPGARFVRARSILEWRVAPERLDNLATEFALECWNLRQGEHRFRS